MITETEYFAALKIVNQYTAQIKKKSDDALKLTVLTKTPLEIKRDYETDYLPNASVRLLNILFQHFENTRLCDITKEDFLSKRCAGRRSWAELCELLGKDN